VVKKIPENLLTHRKQMPYCPDLTTVSKECDFITSDPQGKELFMIPGIALEKFNLTISLTLNEMVPATQALNVMFSEDQDQQHSKKYIMGKLQYHT
jgi:hypothetical protein